MTTSITYTKDDQIPMKDCGYVITMDGIIHALKYKFSHAYVIATLFPDRLSEYKLSLDDLDLDNSTVLASDFSFDMPTIRVSRTMPYMTHTYIYDVWYNNDLSPESITSLKHLLFNVYGCDGYEKVESPMHDCHVRNINTMMFHVRDQKTPTTTVLVAYKEADDDFKF